MIDLEQQAGTVLNITGRAIRRVLTPKEPWQIAITLAVVAAVAGGAYLWGRRASAPSVPASVPPAGPAQEGLGCIRQSLTQ
ncbi:hypothetical protein ACWEKU_11705 [Streptomyces californicus]